MIDRITSRFWNNWPMLLLIFALATLAEAGILIQWLTTFGFVPMVRGPYYHYLHLVVIWTSPVSGINLLRIMDDAMWHFTHHHLDVWLD